MAGVIDTNILVYAANRDAEEHHAAFSFLTAAAEGADPWYLTEGILYEFLRVTTHPKVFDRPLTWRQAIEFLQPLLQNPDFRLLEVGENHWEILEQVLSQQQLTGPLRGAQARPVTLEDQEHLVHVAL